MSQNKSTYLLNVIQVCSSLFGNGWTPSACEQRIAKHVSIWCFEKMNIVLQTAVRGVRLLQSVFHVLQLRGETPLHLETRKTQRNNMSNRRWLVMTAGGARWRTVPLPCFSVADSALFWIDSAGSAGPRLWTGTLSLWLQPSACCRSPAGQKRENDRLTCSEMLLNDGMFRSADADGHIEALLETCFCASSRVCCSCRDKMLHSQLFSSSCSWTLRILASFKPRAWDISLFSTFMSSSFLQQNAGRSFVFFYLKFNMAGSSVNILLPLQVVNFLFENVVLLLQQHVPLLKRLQLSSLLFHLWRDS